MVHPAPQRYDDYEYDHYYDETCEERIGRPLGTEEGGYAIPIDHYTDCWSFLEALLALLPDVLLRLENSMMSVSR